MTCHRLCHSAGHVRSGFTLLELMLAVGLTSLLMAAIYGAMSAYWNLALNSHDEIERTQIARSLMKQLARDIQSCTFAEQVIQADNDSSDLGVTSTGTGEPGTSVYKNGLIGTERDLVLYVSYPARDLNYVAAADAAGTVNRDSDLMVVRWLLAESNGGELAAAMAEQHAIDSGGSVAGLARGSGGVTGFGQAIENDNINLQVESTTLLAAEVQDILFEYFDGVDWLREWDSSTLNKMPQALRVELTLRKIPSATERSIEDPLGLPATTHSLVIPVRVASPHVEETAI